MQRTDKRAFNQLRELRVEPDYLLHPEGSVLLSMGNTRVLCAVSIEEGVPRWMKEQEKAGGWITGEYSMLPRSTHTRNSRETRGLRGRTQEIQRLIGRSLRAAFDLEKLGQRTITVDCDVIQADGGTRTASITGGYIALARALNMLVNDGRIDRSVFRAPVAAVSCGILRGQPLLDLCYEEDVTAEVDANFVMNADAQIIEMQGTAEGQPFHRSEYDQLFELAHTGIMQLIEFSRQYTSV